MSPEQLEAVVAEMEDSDNKVGTFRACFPFLCLLVGFVTGAPCFVVGIACGLLTICLAGINPFKGENLMLDGLKRMAIPLVATIGFVFMSSVIKAIGLTEIVANWLAPVLDISPILVMVFVSAVSGGITQSYSASGAMTIPLLPVVIAAGANPLAACVAACGPAAITQHFLTGGRLLTYRR